MLLFPAILPILGTGRSEKLWFPNSDERSDSDPQEDVKINLPYLGESRSPVRAVRWADKALHAALRWQPQIQSQIWHTGSINNT